MIKVLYILIFSFITLFADIKYDTSKIKNYKVIKEFYSNNQTNMMLIRSFTFDSKEFFLAVNVDSLTTHLINKIEFSTFKKFNKFVNTNYDYLVKKVFENSNSLENAGIKNSLKSSSLSEIYLTIDMCPSSKKGFEKEFYKNIINYLNGKKNQLQ